MHKLLLIAIGGTLGTLGRYGLGGLVQERAGSAFPWGTVAVNLLGCFLFGLVTAVVAERASIEPGARALLLVGFMGAFTTFSTFMYETARLVQDGQYLWAGGNLLLQNAAGIVAVVAGLALGRLI